MPEQDYALKILENKLNNLKSTLRGWIASKNADDQMISAIARKIVSLELAIESLGSINGLNPKTVNRLTLDYIEKLGHG